MAATEKSTKEKLLSVLDDLEVLSRELIELLALSRSQKLSQPGEENQILELLIQKDGEFQELMKVAFSQGKVHQEMQLLEKDVEKRDCDIQQLQKQLKEAEHILAGCPPGFLEMRKINVPRLLPLLRLARSVWKQIKRVVGFEDVIAEMPLWNNGYLPALLEHPSAEFWAHHNVCMATAVYQAKEKLKSIEKARKGSISSEELIKYAHRISASNAVCAPLTWVPGDPRRPYPTDLEMRSGLLGQMSNLPTNGVNGHLPGDALAAGRLPDVLAPQYPWQTNDLSMNMLPPNHSNDFLMESLGPNKENEDDVEVMSTDSSSSSSDSD